MLAFFMDLKSPRATPRAAIYDTNPIQDPVSFIELKSYIILLYISHVTSLYISYITVLYISQIIFLYV